MDYTSENNSLEEPIITSSDIEDEANDSLYMKKKYNRLYNRLQDRLDRLSKYHKQIFLENNMIVLIINANNGDIVDANFEARKFYGYSHEAFKKLNIIHISTLPEKEVLEKLLQSQKQHFQKFHFQHRLASGEIRDVEVHTGPLKFMGKRLIYSIVEDITQKIELENEMKKNDIQYRKLFDDANDAIFFIEADENAVPRRFINVNDKACYLLGYSKEHLLKISPFNVLANDERKDEIITSCKSLLNIRKSMYEVMMTSRSGRLIPTEVSMHFFEFDGKIVYLAIARDITERKKSEEKIVQYSRLLEGVLGGIPDVIGVYKPNHTIMFFNQVGYDFLKKPSDEVNGKKCYEILSQKHKCHDCPVEEAIKTKQIVKLEKFFPLYDKYMDGCYSPVLDDSGEVLFVIEQLRDITEKRNLENVLKESEERYRQIVDLSPDSILITVDGIIVLANKEASKYFDNLIGRKIYDFVPGFSNVMEKRINQILENKISKTTFDYKITVDGNITIDVEISSSYMTYQGKSAVLSVLRDITKRKNELNAAAKIQKHGLKKAFPLPDKAIMETLYIPAKTVSGDFFYIHKIDEDHVIGIIGDVSGKGVTAAMNISAFNVLFHEAVLVSNEPLQIVKILNKKVVNYLEERYIAVCCFSIDFKNNKLKVVGAGINQFIFKKDQQKYEEKIIKGPFLGMFEDSIFDEKTIHFQSGDRFYFFTDGLDFMFYGDNFTKDCLDTATITKFKCSLKDSLKVLLTDIEGINDDCTLLALEIK